MHRTRFMTIVAAGAAALFVSSASALDKITVAYFLEWPTANQVAQLEKTYDDGPGHRSGSGGPSATATR